jgi:hypothetical protein
MAWTTIQRRYARKHLPNIHNIKAFTLENSFRGEPIAAFSDYALDNGKMQIDKAAGRGKLRLHSNCWYDFDYRIDPKPATDAPDYGDGK